MNNSASLVPLPGHVHIVGIGGAGMSAIARILLGRHYIVSGSDQRTNALTDALAHDGATIYAGHAASNILGAQMILMSSAIPPNNPEVVAANAGAIPVIKRREALAALTDDRSSARRARFGREARGQPAHARAGRFRSGFSPRPREPARTEHRSRARFVSAARRGRIAASRPIACCCGDLRSRRSPRLAEDR